MRQSLYHPETHFTDDKAGALRQATYLRLRRHWQFVNELGMFDRREVDHHKKFGVHVYGLRRDHPDFLMATSIYHPDTIARSFDHDGSGPEPGLKDETGNWDIRPHRNRLLTVTSKTLETWRAVLAAGDVPLLQTPMVYAVNASVANALDRLGHLKRLRSEPFEFSQGWNETTDFKKGYFAKAWGTPTSWEEVIFQGPNFHLATPFFKVPNSTMRNQNDWSTIDLESLTASALPTTSYKPSGSRARYDTDFTHWGDGRAVAARSQYRVAWRSMTDNVGERSLIPALIPPGAAHVHGVASGWTPRGGFELCRTAAALTSMIADFVVRVAPKSTIAQSSIGRVPVLDGPLVGDAVLRLLRLNCLTSAYADLWSEVMPALAPASDWVGGVDYDGRTALLSVTPAWTANSPLRRAADRRQALVELDAIAAVTLGMSGEELCTIYRTQFAVLYGYDRNTYFYDTNGRLVPTPVLQTFKRKGLSAQDIEGLSEEERTHTNASGNTYVYDLPFVTLDREADMRAAYAHFERVLVERGGA